MTKPTSPPLFPGLEPPGMWFRCDCGNAEAYPYSVIIKMGVQPTGAVSIWAECCSSCAPKAFMYPWGWVLDTGKRVSAFAGEDAATIAGAISLQEVKFKRQHALLKASRS
jgi:hypothetical protein